MSNFLITGGAGFIGGNFLLTMVKKYPSDRWICLDALTYAGDTKKLEPIMGLDNFRFVKGNICDKEVVNALFEEEKFDYVINFAAESHVDRSIDDPDVFLRSNLLGVEVLLNAARKYGIKRFHQISTDEVYGDLPLEGDISTFTEDSSLHPSSPYSASKAAADLLVLAYARTYNLPVSISRCSNNYGPYQYPEKLIPLVIERALHNEPVLIYGTGLNLRDWLDVKEHNRAIDLIVRKGRAGQIYNIAGKNEIQNIEMVKKILKALDKPESLIQYTKDRAGHDRRYSMDISKIQKELHWQNETNFEESLLSTIQWNIDNQEWLKYVGNKQK